MKKGILLIIATFALTVSAQANLNGVGQSERCINIIEAFEEGNTSAAFAMVDAESSNCSSLGDGSPLIAAVKSGNFSAVRRLFESFGANPNMAVPGDGNPLIQAAGRGYRKITEYLIKIGADVDGFVPEDETPLINAAANGHLKIVKILINNGADVNKSVWSESMGNRELRSPISMARRNGQTKVVKFLVEQGATISK